MKSARRVPTAITRSAARASRLAASPPLAPTGPTFQAWFQGSAPLPACGLADGDAEPLGEVGQCGARLGVDDAAAGDDQRPFAPPRISSTARSSRCRRRDGPVDAVDPLLEEVGRIVVGLGLDVLRQRRS